MVAVGACSGGGEPEASRSSSASPTTTPSATTSTNTVTPTTTPSTALSVSVPAAAKAHTDEGAKAFAMFFMEQMSDAYASLDLTTVRALAAADCTGCRVLFQSVEERRARGEHAVSRSFTADVAGVRPNASGDTLEIDVAGTERAVNVVKNGTVLRKTTAGKVTFRTRVHWTSSRWEMKDVKAVTA
jgi:hypothetical protein